MRRSWTLLPGTVLVGLIVLLALVSVFWQPYDPTRVDAAVRLLNPGWPYLFGTDGLGQDIFSRILVGSRVCLQVGVVAVVIGALLGTPLGMAAAASVTSFGHS